MRKGMISYHGITDHDEHSHGFLFVKDHLSAVKSSLFIHDHFSQCCFIRFDNDFI